MKRKLIEVNLPLEAINKESAREKSIRHGHPSTLHLWWARRPLAACRAVLFAQLVDDPSSHPEEFPTEEAQEAERKRLFGIIERLVKWENANNPEVLAEARREILRSTGGNPPPVLDPFCGGGSIPLEAQRLGLEAYGSDLNPVAVLITRALVEIPPKFAGLPAVHPRQEPEKVRSEAGKQIPIKKFDHGAQDWRGTRGLAEDIRYYGEWIRAEAEKQIGRYYPQVELPQEYGGGKATVIAWLWARTVASPNPACQGAQVPLVRSFVLSTRKGKEAWVEPVVDHTRNTYRFEVQTGEGKPPEGTVNRRGATCLLSGVPMPFEYIRAEGKAGRMGTRLMAIVAEGPRGRVYLAPNKAHEDIARQTQPQWVPEFPLPHNPRNFNTSIYGIDTYDKLFTPRQLLALTTFSDLVQEAKKQVYEDARRAGMPDDGQGLAAGGRGAMAYAEAVATYLAFAVDRLSDYSSSICSWHSGREAIGHTFTRQAIPMTWDFAEANPFSDSTGNWSGAVAWVAEVVENLPGAANGQVQQRDATVESFSLPVCISTDPPYYDNIGYADLADFFYIWLRRSLRGIYPELQTVLTPKTSELVATPYRFAGDKNKAKTFFETGLSKAFQAMRAASHPDYPLTIYYAFKQAEAENGQEKEANHVVSTGWETMLNGLIQAGFTITGTWPMRTELENRSLAIGTNALASSIVLVCRPRAAAAPLATKRDFLAELKRELPKQLHTLQQGNIAPVDLAQAAIGPGMAIFTRYSKVLEADGTPMSVRAALGLINQVLDEYLSAQEGEYDDDTRWALAWFGQFGMEEGPFGEAEILSKAKNTAIAGLVEAGILTSKGGKVRLLRRDELPADWEPNRDQRLTVWEATQHLIRVLEKEGEEGAAKLLIKINAAGGATGEAARALAYRLYTICERQGWTQEALAYNSLVTSWPEIDRLANEERKWSARLEDQEDIAMGAN